MRRERKGRRKVSEGRSTERDFKERQEEDETRSEEDMMSSVKLKRATVHTLDIGV